MAAVVDPANAGNIVSNELTRDERNRIGAAAAHALEEEEWARIVV